ncbi:hypothetical protein IE4872_CH03467 [Rhizobium gallicum]|uniref:Uncharacterized protein n=1 Tax=Rhizobium gallicum TaxID=56730 RepID=A0A1L5NMC8_9HYPH|nr:hypothetical protein IE4872_CH03467 [Rhizobium gallicum]
MNAQQALPAEEGMKFSHPNGKPGETDVLLNREQLDKVVKDKASANKREAAYVK